VTLGKPVKRTADTYEICSHCGHFIYESQPFDQMPKVGKSVLRLAPFHINSSDCAASILRGEPREQWGPSRSMVARQKSFR
jgi:hypothetical protein